MRIPKLKPNSPEFWVNETDEKHTVPPCDHPTCAEDGIYQAPKSTEELDDFFYFCLEHVREYNSKWNYFKNFTPGQIEEQIRKDSAWDRPTQRSGVNPLFEERLRQKIYDDFAPEDVKFKFKGFSFEEWEKRQREKKEKEENLNAHNEIPEMEALDVLGLEPPTDLVTIKAKYKRLVKKYHPDLNQGCKEAEENIKKINAAYSILKNAYGQYEKIVKD